MAGWATTKPEGCFNYWAQVFMLTGGLWAVGGWGAGVNKYDALKLILGFQIRIRIRLDPDLFYQVQILQGAMAVLR
jgi:hypothetical protein